MEPTPFLRLRRFSRPLSFPGSQRCLRGYAVQSLSGAPLLRGHAEGDAAVHEEPGRRGLVEEALIVSYRRRVRLEMIAHLHAGWGVATRQAACCYEVRGDAGRSRSGYVQAIVTSLSPRTCRSDAIETNWVCFAKTHPCAQITPVATYDDLADGATQRGLPWPHWAEPAASATDASHAHAMHTASPAQRTALSGAYGHVAFRDAKRLKHLSTNLCHTAICHP
jgi:hypothetical protein